MPRSPAAELAPLVQLLAEDRRYKVDAYHFVGAGLQIAQQANGGKRRSASSPRRSSQQKVRSQSPKGICHVTGQQLCWALRQLAHDQFGFMARLVLASWGIHSTSDFGEIVFSLIRLGQMSKSENDRREDFDNVYDFEQALVRDYAITKEEELCPP